jgi:hypothetical protein
MVFNLVAQKSVLALYYIEQLNTYYL